MFIILALILGAAVVVGALAHKIAPNHKKTLRLISGGVAACCLLAMAWIAWLRNNRKTP